MNGLNNFNKTKKVLNDAYRFKYETSSKFKYTKSNSTIKPITKFSLDFDINNIKLPLTCSGRLITAGEYYDGSVGEDVILSEEELVKSLINWTVPIMKSHAATDSMAKGYDVSIDHIVGEVGMATWDDIEGGINWQGIVADEDLARKIALGLIKFGSVTFARDIERREDGRLYYTNIMPLDFSLVFNPKDKNASIKMGGL